MATGKTVTLASGKVLTGADAQNYGKKTTSSSSSSVKAPAPVTNLKIGSTGAEVKALQQKLGITADGIFGPQTQAAVKAYQAKNGLAVDGIAGMNTQGKLGGLSTTGMIGDTTATGGAIAADGLLNTPKYTPPPAPVITNNAAPYINSIEPAKIETPIEANQTKVTSLIDQLTGRDAYAKKLENKYGVSDDVKRLQEVNLQIAQAKNQFAAMTNLAGNKAIPMPFIVGEQTQIANTQAIQLGALAATAQALQGNIELSNQLIDRALEIKFEPIEKELTYRMNLYEQLKDDMTASEKLAVQNNLSKDGSKYNAYLEAMDYAMKTVAANAPAGDKARIMSAIAKARTAEEVYTASEGYAYDPKTTTGGMTPAQVTSSVNTIRGAFDNEPIVKAYNVVSEQVNYVNQLQDTPTDDQARIYAFAKVMDPNSAVREGEYKTVQKYSQALLERLGMDARRIISNEGFLTQEARNFIKNTLQTRLNSYQKQYDNVASEYQRQINDVYAGKPAQITDYGAAFTGGGDSVQVQTKVGTLDLSTWGE